MGGGDEEEEEERREGCGWLVKNRKKKYIEWKG